MMATLLACHGYIDINLLYYRKDILLEHANHPTEDLRRILRDLGRDEAHLNDSTLPLGDLLPTNFDELRKISRYARSRKQRKTTE